ncbi:MAG: sigma-70 family RNA polymerase sigma factor [Candidatus Liptonbacteria bacterium]|nr:sigma-70 family RNA polymerase sigma factor [Candidatus Liptonbacteria bacterium]
MLDGEERFIQAATEGESSAFGELYDHYQPKIYRFVLVKVSRREDAEDLTHQVFLNAWQNIATYRSRGFPFSSWLYRIARNVVVDHYRAKKPEFSVEDLDPEGVAGMENHESQAEHSLGWEKVMSALRQLPAQYQEVILLRFVEELSVRETAAAIKKSEGATKVLQHRAIQHLRELLPLTDLPE